MAYRLVGNKFVNTNDPQFQMYNALGRDAGATSGDDNFFTKRWKSIDNAVGTTGAAITAGLDSAIENQNIENRLNKWKNSINDIYKKYGYENEDAYYNAKDAAEAETFGKYGYDADNYWDKHAELYSPSGDNADALKALEDERNSVISKMSQEDADKIRRFDSIQNELINQSNANRQEAKEASDNWRDYRENSDVGKRINQDRGKFLGSAINTLSTAADVMLPGAGVAFNAVQGGVEGIADELEQNGLQNFDWGRAGQNALIGGITGGVVGGLNKGLSNSLAKNGGNLFKGGNRFTNFLNNAGSKTALGRGAATLATGASRGAISGAVGGATGAGLSSALNGVEFGQGIQNALQGAVQGAQQGAMAGGVMAGANMALNATPGAGKAMQKINQAGADWENSGDTFSERWKNARSQDTWGNRFLNNRVEDAKAVRQGFKNVGEGIKVLANETPLANIGMSIKDVNDNRIPLDESMRRINNVRNGESGAETIGKLPTDYMQGETASDINYADRVLKHISEGGINHEITPQELAYSTNNYSNSKIMEFMSDSGKNHLDIVKPIGGDNSLVIGLEKQPNGNLLVTDFKQKTDSNYIRNLQKNKNATVLYDTTSSAFPATTSSAEPASFGVMDRGDNSIIQQSKQNVNRTAQLEQSLRDLDAEGVPFTSPRYQALYEEYKKASSYTPGTNNSLKEGDTFVKNGEVFTVEKGHGRNPKLLAGVSQDRRVLTTLPFNQQFEEPLDGSWNMYEDFVSSPKVYKHLADSIEAQYAENPRAKIGDTIIEPDRLISEYADRLSPEEYKQFDVQSAEDALYRELNRLEEAKGFGTTVPSQKNTPETEVYRTLTGEASNKQWDTLAQESGFDSYNDAVKQFKQANPNMEATAENVTDFMDATLENGKKTFTQAKSSKTIKNERAIQEEIIDQFNPVREPTVRSTKPRETFYNLYNDLGLSDADQIRQAVHYAEPGELVPTIIREAAGQAGVVDITDAKGLIDNLKLNKRQNYTKTLNVVEDIIDSTDSTISGGKSGVDALQLQRALEQAASDALGSNGTYHIGSNLVDATTAQNLRRVANAIGNSLDEAVAKKNGVAYALNKYAPEIQEMRNSQPNNLKWQAYIDNEIAGATSVKQLRSAIKDLTRASMYIADGDNRIGTTGSRMTRGAAIPTTKAGIANRLINDTYEKAESTPMARKARLARAQRNIDKENASANANANSSANAANTNNININLANNQSNTSTGLFDALKNRIGNRESKTPTPISDMQAANTDYNPATQVYNAIGRTEGATNAEQARTSNYIANAVQNANTLEDLATPAYSTNATSVYNSIYGNPSSTNGDYWTSVLSNAMDMARAAGDANAFAQLYSMYQDATSKQSSTTETKLTDKQRQANAAARALADFEAAEPNFAYDVSDIPVIGGIANLGGNEYTSKAEALALQIGYMLSGATVNKEEAKNIGMAYVPQPRDSEAVRKSKLAQLRGIISDYQQTYAD